MDIDLRAVYTVDFGDAHGTDPGRVVESHRLWSQGYGKDETPLVISDSEVPYLDPPAGTTNPHPVGHLTIGRDMFGPGRYVYPLGQDDEVLVKALEAVEIPPLSEDKEEAATRLITWQLDLNRAGLCLGIAQVRGLWTPTGS